MIPAWERVFWGFIGFAQGYCTCLLTPHLTAWCIELRDRWRARRKPLPAVKRRGSSRPHDDWYFIDGVRYCWRCRTRRCDRQPDGGWLPCIPAPEKGASP